MSGQTVYGRDGLIAECGITRRAPETNDANAEFIVRACNSHDDLLAALRRAQQFIQNGIECGYIRMPDTAIDSALSTPDMIAAAIAKAEVR